MKLSLLASLAGIVSLCGGAHAQTQSPAPSSPNVPPTAAPASTTAAPTNGQASSSQQSAATVPSQMTLDECLKLADLKHPDIITSQLYVTAAEQRVKESHAGYLPRVDTTAYYIRQTYNTAAQPGQSQAQVAPYENGQNPSTLPYYDGNLSASQTIYDFGRTKGSVLYSRAELEAARQDLERTRQVVHLNVRTSYYSVLAAEELVRIEQDNVTMQSSQLDQIKAFYQVGTRPKIDVTNQEVSLKNSQVNLVQAMESLSVSRAALATSMGIPIEQSPEPANTLNEEQPLEKLDTLLAAAARQRPDLLSAHEQVLAAQGNIIRARANFRPDFSWQGFFDYRNFKFPLIYNFSLGGFFLENLYHGGADRALVAEYSADELAAESSYTSLMNNVRQQVFTAYSDMAVSKEQIDLAIESERAAQENLELAKGRYDNGYGNIIELTDAQAQNTSSEAQVVSTRFNYQAAAAQLDAALGR